MIERRKKWSFYVLGDGTWVWRVLHPDGTEQTAERAFATLIDCTADATRYGYVVVPPEKERRRSTVS